MVAVLLWRGPAVERSSLPPAGVKRSIAVLALLLAFTLALLVFTLALPLVVGLSAFLPPLGVHVLAGALRPLLRVRLVFLFFFVVLFIFVVYFIYQVLSWY